MHFGDFQVSGYVNAGNSSWWHNVFMVIEKKSRDSELDKDDYRRMAQQWMTMDQSE
jgi:hypothetical protein